MTDVIRRLETATQKLSERMAALLWDAEVRLACPCDEAKRRVLSELLVRLPALWRDSEELKGVCCERIAAHSGLAELEEAAAQCRKLARALTAEWERLSEGWRVAFENICSEEEHQLVQRVSDYGAAALELAEVCRKTAADLTYVLT